MLPQGIGGNCKPDLDDGAEGGGRRARAIVAMRVKLRPGGSRPRQNQIEHRLCPPFRVPGQLERSASRDGIISRVWSFVGFPWARASMSNLSL